MRSTGQEKRHILCTGGAGYIGSHTVISLIENNYRVTIVDNLANSDLEILKRIKKIVKNERIEKNKNEKNDEDEEEEIDYLIQFVQLDLKNFEKLDELFQKNKFAAIIHYAGLKAVGESTEKPLDYYETNIMATINLLKAMKNANVKKLVFSSSATVYRAKEEKIKEDDPLQPFNPYGQTKFMIEQILKDLFTSDPTWSISILRYFNPIGADKSGLMGDSPLVPNNLLPCIQQVAVGRKDKLKVFGNDWPTRDGTGVRDYLHVKDLAEGHIAALNYLFKVSPGVFIHNLGTGGGVSVLEMIKYFEEASGKKIPYEIVSRRPGDLASVIADCQKAEKELGWKAKRTIKEGCASAWNWQFHNPYGYEKKKLIEKSEETNGSTNMRSQKLKNKAF